MISEPLGMLADIAAAIIVMFIFPFLWAMGMQNSIEDRYIRKAAEEFTDQICSMGYIDEAAYDAFAAKVALAGSRKSIEITETVERYEPVYEHDVFTGQIIEYRSTRGTETILDMIYNEGTYECVDGGLLNVMIYDNGTGYVNCFGTIRGRRAQ